MQILLLNFVQNFMVNIFKSLFFFPIAYYLYIEIPMNGLIYLLHLVQSMSVLFMFNCIIFLFLLSLDMWFSLARFATFLQYVLIVKFDIFLSNSIMKVSQCGHQNIHSIGMQWTLVQSETYSVNFALQSTFIFLVCFVIR
jgi:hypothetical protein